MYFATKSALLNELYVPLKTEMARARSAPLGAIADSAMDALIREPDGAEERSRVAFEAVWRVLAG